MSGLWAEAGGQARRAPGRFILFRLPTEIVDFTLDAFPTTGAAEVLEIAKLAHVDRPESREPENAFFQFVGGIAEDNPLHERDGVGSDEHSGAPALQKSFPGKLTCELEGKPRHPRPVKKTLEKRRHGRSPRRIEDDEVFAPAHVFLEGDKVRF